MYSALSLKYHHMFLVIPNDMKLKGSDHLSYLRCGYVAGEFAVAEKEIQKYSNKAVKL